MSLGEADRKRKAAEHLASAKHQEEIEPPKQKPKALPSPPQNFVVTYSRLCDGGMQEMTTAAACVNEVFPNATIRTNRRQLKEDMDAGPNPSLVISLDDCDDENESDNGNAGNGKRDKTTSINGGQTTKTNESGTVLWSREQRNLFEKYPKKRRKSIKDIRECLIALKESWSAASSSTTTSNCSIISTAPPISKSVDISTNNGDACGK